MDIPNYIITPLTCAIIGYSTNWLAIKMLFRPHYEKRLFGIKMPFTPGLIPKERERLSKKIAETIGEHMITEDMLKEAFLSKDMSDSAKELLNENFNLLAQNTMSVSEILSIILKTNEKENLDLVSNILLKSKKIFENESLILKVSEVINDKVTLSIQNFDIKKHFPNTLEYLENIVIEKGMHYLSGDNFMQLVKEKISEAYNGSLENDKKLIAYTDEQTLLHLKNFLNDIIPVIAKNITNILTDNQVLNDKLKIFVDNTVDDSVGKLALMFVNKEKVYDNIKDGIIQFLQNEENHQMIYEKTEKLMRDILEWEVLKLTQKISYETIENITINIIESIKSSNSNDFIKKAFEYFKNRIQNQESINLYSLLIEFEPKFEDSKRELISSFANSFIKNEILPFIENQCEACAEYTLNLKVNYLFDKISINAQSQLKSFLFSIVSILIEKGTSHILSNLNLNKMVENQINSFEVDRTEKIILSVVKKELGVITSLGGIFGFMLGLLTVVIQ